jgi:diadenylate cyclase
VRDLLAAGIEIAVLAFAIYVLLRFVRSTRGSGFVRGLSILFVFFAVVLRLAIDLLGLPRLEFVYGGSLSTLVLVLAIIFQPELRRGIARLGEHPLVQRFAGSSPTGTIGEVCRAVAWLAHHRRGALLAFEREDSLETYVEGGVALDARVDHLLLESIFQKTSPLHDGAVVLRRERVAAAACLFPLSENPEISKRLGTRHRAALGLTEETDAVAILVSEETGGISLSFRGKLEPVPSVSALERELGRALWGARPEVPVPAVPATVP